MPALLIRMSSRRRLDRTEDLVRPRRARLLQLEEQPAAAL